VEVFIGGLRLEVCGRGIARNALFHYRQFQLTAKIYEMLEYYLCKNSPVIINDVFYIVLDI